MLDTMYYKRLCTNSGHILNPYDFQFRSEHLNCIYDFPSGNFKYVGHSNGLTRLTRSLEKVLYKT